MENEDNPVASSESDEDMPSQHDDDDGGDCPEGTPDERRFPRFAASFSKLLQHFPAGATSSPDRTGLLTNQGVEDYERFRLALRGGPTGEPFDDCLLDNLRLENRDPPQPEPCPGQPEPTQPAGPRVLVNPRSSKALAVGAETWQTIDVAEILYRQRNRRRRLLREISLSSDESAAEIVEVYGQSLLRDEDLGNYSGATAQLVVDALNSFGDDFIWTYDRDGNRVTATDYPVTLDNLFRGVCDAMPDDGPYLSGFLTLIRPPLFPAGCAPEVASLIRAEQFAVLGTLLEVVQGPFIGNNAREFALTLEEYAKIQNAEVPRPYSCDHFDTTGVIRTGRHLGDYVHTDNSYEQYIRATDIMVANQIDRSPNSPYTAPSLNPNEGDGPTLGPGDAWSLIGAVRAEAERGAWTQKYLVARRARPEVMAALIHLARSDPSHPLRNDLSPALLATSGPVHDLLEAVRARNASLPGGESNYLLPQMFPEASPAHPAWTSGHATIAGACVTAVKAIFDNLATIKVPEFGGEEPTIERTIKCELDKVASNIAIGRDWAGVHYRADGEHGILLGEEIAIQYLQSIVRTYAERGRRFDGFILIKRNGQVVRIMDDCVREGGDYPTGAELAEAAAAAAAPAGRTGRYWASNL